MPRIYCSVPEARPGVFNGHEFRRHDERTLLSVHNLDPETAEHFCSVPGFAVAHDVPPDAVAADPRGMDLGTLALTLTALSLDQINELGDELRAVNSPVFVYLGGMATEVGGDLDAPGAGQTDAPLFVPGGHDKAQDALVANLSASTAAAAASKAAAASAGSNKATKTVKVAVRPAPDAR